MPSPGRTAVLLGLLYGLAGASSSAVSVALPELAHELRVTPATAVWTVSAFTVALAVATPVHGRLADMFGIRLPLAIGIIAMSLGALAAALAPSFPVLVVARVVQGVGAAAVPVLGTALISARWDGPVRGSALGRIAGISATLTTLGPIMGGGLEAVGGWRWAMAVPVIGLFAAPLVWRLAPRAGSGERIDVTGALLVAAGASGLVLLLQSPSAGPEAALVGAILLGTGAPLLAWWVHRRSAGFLPREIVTNTTVLRSAGASAAVPATWFALLIGVPLAAAAWGWTPLAIGALLLPAAVTGLVSPRLARFALARYGSRRTIGIACPAAVLALLAAAAGTALGWPVLLAVAVVVETAAFGIGQPAMLVSVGAAVPAALRGVALGIATLVYLAGASVGAALVGGLAGVVGVAGAFLVLIVVPVAGFAGLLLGGPDRVEAPTPTP